MSINSNNNLLNEILSTIDNLPTSKEEQEKSITIIENGTTEVIPDEGKTLSKVTVNVEVAQSGGGEFVGIKLSDFTESGKPRIMDMSTLSLKGNEYVEFLFRCSDSYTGYYDELREVYLPDTLTTVSRYMFSYCKNLTDVYGVLSNVTDVVYCGFGGCKSLSKIPYMPNLRKIDQWAFWETALTEFKLPITITSIASNAFHNCPSLTDIYCPWAEGAVANAPWGATNATIHYNTTYDENGNPITTEV